MDASLAHSNWVIYGLRLVGSTEYRYIGLTRQKPSQRLYQHQHPTHNPKVPVSKWALAHKGEVVMDILEEIPVGDEERLYISEMYWISQIRSFGHRLLNLSDG